MTSSKRKARFKKRIGRKELKKKEWETKALKKLEEIFRKTYPHAMVRGKLISGEISERKKRIANKSARTVLKIAKLNALFRTLAKEVPEIKRTISQEGITLSARSKKSLDRVLSSLAGRLEYTGVSPRSIKRIREGKIGKKEFRILYNFGELTSRASRDLILRTAKRLRKDPKYKSFGTLNLSRFVHRELLKQEVKLSPETVHIYMKKDKSWREVKPKSTLKQRFGIEKIIPPEVPGKPRRIRVPIPKIEKPKKASREKIEAEKNLREFRPAFEGTVPSFGMKFKRKGKTVEVGVSKNIGYVIYRKGLSFLIFRKLKGKNEIIRKGILPQDLVRLFGIQGKEKSGGKKSIPSAKKDMIISSMWGRPLDEIAKVVDIEEGTIRIRARRMGF